MSFTNQTPNFGLPQWIGTDKPTFLGDLNGAFSDIDTALKNNADASAAATATANSASATATSANTNATTALGTANSAASDAASAVTTAQSADTKATQALSAASGAETAAAANTIENLAPAYDNTLTYDVGDLVTFVDAQGHGRLYKCVVAVNSPMDFNINYWDDVTASEVFRGVPLKIATHVQSTSETYAAALYALYSSLTTAIDNKRDYILMETITGSKLKWNLEKITYLNDLYFTSVSVGANYGTENNRVICSGTSGNNGFSRYIAMGTNQGFVAMDSLTPSDEITWEIYLV